MVAEMVLEGEIDVYVEHGVEEPEIAIHMIEGPPENGEDNADGQDGQNVNDLGGDDFVKVEEDEERVQVDEERVEEDEKKGSGRRR
ncbi:hypothetical protein COLO4_23420 [Corchorus olitorius]|uniref:Uncharacterized protein n=1 Tax=Corchorus olitorius TaxID=93759 RepID=A0A1R3IGY4_9ROSI|nr:hypothetical protein COLO4_23420 [Corchorus olitorius]